jgi:hypothetical protein
VLRPFLSLLLASVATAVGLAVLLISGHRQVSGLARLVPEPNLGAEALVLLGLLLIGVAAGSLMLHWLGVFVVGAVHLLLGGLAVLIPLSGPLSGAYSPTWEISGMLRDLDPSLGAASVVFFYSGAAAVLGAFLIGAALGVRSRWGSPPAAAATVAISSVVGGVVLLVSLVLLVVAGEQFVTYLLVQVRYLLPLALAVAGAVILAGVGGLTLRWSSAGVILIGALALVAGVVAIFVGASLAVQFASPRVVAYGFLPALGVTFIVAGIAGRSHRASVSEPTVAL